tara:strand:- start:705 stop:1907 length:1203 start_codon:yes stop_codon:yes gene_type:complete
MSNFTDFNKAFNNPTQNNYEYNSLIIKPPDRNKTHGTITKTLVIDSRDRDYNKYPDSNKYRVEITEEYRDVTSLELVYGQLPNSYYNLNVNNNNFYISENDKIYKYQIPEGSYTNDSLIKELNKGNIFEDVNNKYNFSRGENNLKLRIQSNDSFIYNVNYEHNNECSACPMKSIDKLLGFKNQSYQSRMVDLSHIYVDKNNIINLNKNSEDDYKLYKITASSSNSIPLNFKNIFVKGDYFKINASHLEYSCRIYNTLNKNTIIIEILDDNPLAVYIHGNIFTNIHILTSPNIYNIENNDYVIIKISEAKVINSLTTSVNNSYTVIPLKNNDNTIINQSSLPEHGITKYFNPPLGKLFWLDIEFLNYDGSPFNFNGQENMLMFVISQLNQPGKYNNIIDKL